MTGNTRQRISMPNLIFHFYSFTITPLIDNFGGKPPICSISFFSNNFKVIVVHWESYNVVYVQSVQAHEFTVRLLDELLAFYDKNGDILQDHSPQTLCAGRISVNLVIFISNFFCFVIQ